MIYVAFSLIILLYDVDLFGFRVRVFEFGELRSECLWLFLMILRLEACLGKGFKQGLCL